MKYRIMHLSFNLIYHLGIKLSPSMLHVSGIMLNLGGITGNLLISTLIQDNLGFLSLSITLALLIWLVGSFSWIIPYFYYLKEFKLRKVTMPNKRKVMRINQT